MQKSSPFGTKSASLSRCAPKQSPQQQHTQGLATPTPTDYVKLCGWIEGQAFRQCESKLERLSCKKNIVSASDHRMSHIFQSSLNNYYQESTKEEILGNMKLRRFQIEHKFEEILDELNSQSFSRTYTSTSSKIREKPTSAKQNMRWRFLFKKKPKPKPKPTQMQLSLSLKPSDSITPLKAVSITEFHSKPSALDQKTPIKAIASY